MDQEVDLEDMSIDSSSDDEEVNDSQEQIEITNNEETLPTISLSFGNSKGGAWDDRELINAYNASLEEFHVSSSFTTVTWNGYSGQRSQRGVVILWKTRMTGWIELEYCH